MDKKKFRVLIKYCFLEGRNADEGKTWLDTEFPDTASGKSTIKDCERKKTLRVCRYDMFRVNIVISFLITLCFNAGEVSVQLSDTGDIFARILRYQYEAHKLTFIKRIIRTISTNDVSNVTLVASQNILDANGDLTEIRTIELFLHNLAEPTKTATLGSIPDTFNNNEEYYSSKMIPGLEIDLASAKYDENGEIIQLGLVNKHQKIFFVDGVYFMNKTINVENYEDATKTIRLLRENEETKVTVLKYDENMQFLPSYSTIFPPHLVTITNFQGHIDTNMISTMLGDLARFYLLYKNNNGRIAAAVIEDLSTKYPDTEFFALNKEPKGSYFKYDFKVELKFDFSMSKRVPYSILIFGLKFYDENSSSTAAIVGATTVANPQYSLLIPSTTLPTSTTDLIRTADSTINDDTTITDFPVTTAVLNTASDSMTDADPSIIAVLPPETINNTSNTITGTAATAYATPDVFIIGTATNLTNSDVPYAPTINITSNLSTPTTHPVYNISMLPTNSTTDPNILTVRNDSNISMPSINIIVRSTTPTSYTDISMPPTDPALSATPTESPAPTITNDDTPSATTTPESTVIASHSLLNMSPLLTNVTADTSTYTISNTSVNSTADPSIFAANTFYNISMPLAYISADSSTVTSHIVSNISIPTINITADSINPAAHTGISITPTEPALPATPTESPASIIAIDDNNSTPAATTTPESTVLASHSVSNIYLLLANVTTDPSTYNAPNTSINITADSSILAANTFYNISTQSTTITVDPNAVAAVSNDGDPTLSTQSTDPAVPDTTTDSSTPTIASDDNNNTPTVYMSPVTSATPTVSTIIDVPATSTIAATTSILDTSIVTDNEPIIVIET
ncbi:hypothetical protein GWI33_008915 [Rhynchophorus ferrugineus]|uniref:Uncharacterized protein n=1 Tax=Rhynchophorus ferrugineus TaxID=354439 RepID=A0A834MJ97_RHYFE|nr:hypothetical protein GWI33_008915 [Rhynchophorus ferrugineus]